MDLRRFYRLAAGLLVTCALGATLPACGDGNKTYELTDVRERKDAGPPAEPTSAAKRFGARDAQDAGEADARPTWNAKTPAGWKEFPPAPMRDLAWSVPGGPGAECTFSALPKRGAGLLANVNRWRKQMSLEPIDEAALASLPKKTMLDREATLVELSGTYVGMGGTAPVESAKLLGLVTELPMAWAFLKMTGPASVVDAESAHFFELAASISMARSSAKDSPATPAPSPEPARQGPFAWKVPDGWTEGPPRDMRLATFLPSKAPGSECSVVLLSGAAGGAKANIDRWAGQLGLPDTTDAEFGKLERRTILGKPAVFCTFEGKYSGMGGGPAKAKWMLLGMVLERADDVVFVKLTGPADGVKGERERFLAFCESFHE